MAKITKKRWYQKRTWWRSKEKRDYRLWQRAKRWGLSKSNRAIRWREYQRAKEKRKWIDRIINRFNRPKAGYATKHFKFSWFDCRNGIKLPSYMRNDIVTWCKTIGEPMKKKYGHVFITSAYRTLQYNRDIGSSDGSYHVYTKRKKYPAVDFTCSRGSPAQWGAYVNKLISYGGVGVYKRSGFIHVDLRNYRSRGFGN